MTAEPQISERLIRNYAGAFSAWAASMQTDPALDALFFERIGMDPDTHRALPLPENMAVNLRYRRWQAQCGITAEQSPEERLALAMANDDPVVD